MNNKPFQFVEQHVYDFDDAGNKELLFDAHSVLVSFRSSVMENLKLLVEKTLETEVNAVELDKGWTVIVDGSIVRVSISPGFPVTVHSPFRIGEEPSVPFEACTYAIATETGLCVLSTPTDLQFLYLGSSGSTLELASIANVGRDGLRNPYDEV